MVFVKAAATRHPRVLGALYGALGKSFVTLRTFVVTSSLMDDRDMSFNSAFLSESCTALGTFIVTFSLMHDRYMFTENTSFSEFRTALRTFVDIRPRSKHRWRPRKTKDIYLKKFSPPVRVGVAHVCDALAFGDACGRLPRSRGCCVRDLTRAAQ